MLEIFMIETGVLYGQSAALWKHVYTKRENRFGFRAKMDLELENYNLWGLKQQLAEWLQAHEEDSACSV